MSHDVSARSAAAGEDRRKFAVRLFWGLTGALGVLVGAPVLAALVSPGFRKAGRADWVAVGPVSSFGATPTLAHHVHPAREGWVNATGEMQVWVVKTAQGDLKVFDNHCTHLGCPYHWETSASRFYCPCHNAVFDATGQVVSGPPPRPLDYYETKVEGGTLYMGALHRGGT